MHPAYFYRYNDTYRILNHSAVVETRNSPSAMRNHIGLASLLDRSPPEEVEDSSAVVSDHAVSQGLLDIIGYIAEDRERNTRAFDGVVVRDIPGGCGLSALSINDLLIHILSCSVPSTG